MRCRSRIAGDTCVTNCSSFQWADAANRPARWGKAASDGRLFVHGFFRFLWRDARVQIREVDAAARTLSTGGAPINKGAGVTNGSLWYAYNLLEELDEPGEFVLEHATGILSTIFPAGCVSAAGDVACRTRVVPAVPTYANGNPTAATPAARRTCSSATSA